MGWPLATQSPSMTTRIPQPRLSTGQFAVLPPHVLFLAAQDVMSGKGKQSYGMEVVFRHDFQCISTLFQNSQHMLVHGCYGIHLFYQSLVFFNFPFMKFRNEQRNWTKPQLFHIFSISLDYFTSSSLISRWQNHRPSTSKAGVFQDEFVRALPELKERDQAD